MPASPVEAEATGQEFVEATFSGTTFQVPLDVDSWPLESILRCRAVSTADEIVVDATQLATALQAILGTQWPAFARLARKKRQLITASHIFADAVGIPASSREPADVVFGGIPRLLTLLKYSPGKVESDLHHFWDIDYTDRWRFTRRRRRRLTLRKIYACLSNPPKTGAEIATLDVYEAITRQRHPSRPMPADQAKARDADKAAEDKAVADYRERQNERKSRQQAGLDTARANARISQRGNAHAQARSRQDPTAQ